MWDRSSCPWKASEFFLWTLGGKAVVGLLYSGPLHNISSLISLRLLVSLIVPLVAGIVFGYQEAKRQNVRIVTVALAAAGGMALHTIIAVTPALWGSYHDFSDSLWPASPLDNALGMGVAALSAVLGAALFRWRET